VAALGLASCEGRSFVVTDDEIESGDGDGDGDGDPSEGDGDGDPGDGDPGDGDGDLACAPIVDSLTITDETELASVACVEVVVGDLTIGPTTQMFDLQAFTSLRKVGGTATIVGNLSLTSLDGLGSLSSVEWLHIRRNRNLSDLHGLDGLTAVERITITDNDGMTSVAGLPAGLAPWRLEVADNLLLASLDGLPSFEAASTSEAMLVDIDDNAALIDLGGLTDCCANQRIDLSLARNASLEDLGGLEGFVRLARLRLFDNRALISLDGLDELVEVGTLELGYDPCNAGPAPSLSDLLGAPQLAGVEVLRIEWVSSLTSLAGLAGLTSLAELQIRNNAALPWEAVLDLEAQTSPEIVDTCGGVGGPACPDDDPCQTL
jgi:hypothetical protein